MLLAEVDGIHRLQQVEGDPDVLTRPQQGPHVFGEAGPPIPRPGKQECRADAVVRTNSLAHQVHIGPNLLTQLRDLVHERNARGEHGVGGVFRDLGGGYIGEDERVAGADERSVQFGQHLGRFVGVDPHHDAVGFHEIVDRRPLLEKLRIRAHMKVGGRVLSDRLSHLFRRANGNRAFGDDDLRFVHVFADRLGHREHVLQVG